MEPNLRYLAALRLSSDSDASTAIEGQLRGIEHHLAAPHVSGILAGIAEDTDVSGGLSPFKRPELGTWLKRPEQFDVIIAYRLDRLTRRSLHFNELLKWCQDNGKYIVCVEEGFDLSTGPGKMMAQIAAVFAEAEWDAIQARIMNGVKTRLENRSWIVGAPPTGYRIKSVEGERRKVLEIDPKFEWVVKEIFARVLEGQSTHRIAKDFNIRGVRTWVTICVRPKVRGSRVRNGKQSSSTSSFDPTGCPESTPIKVKLSWMIAGSLSSFRKSPWRPLMNGIDWLQRFSPRLRIPVHEWPGVFSPVSPSVVNVVRRWPG
ncbi:recombinase family protein [Streptomyces sp. NPDC003042]